MAKVITIAQQKGGAGKSTVAAHIAIALSQKSKKIMLFDIDPQGSLTMWYDLRERKLGKGCTGLNFISSSGWRLGSALSSAKSNHDYIIIDCPPHTETEAKTAIRSADLVLVPMQPSPTDLWATKATLDFAKSEKKSVKVLFNRNNNSKVAKEIMSQINESLTSSLGSRVAFSSCFNYGACVTETDPHSHASTEVKNLIDEIFSFIE